MQMFESIDQYILKSKDERQSHLDLKTECIEIGGADSKHYRGLLAHALKTTIPMGRKIHLCHACHNHKCSNVKHLYWGTVKENRNDAFSCGANSYEKIKKGIIDKFGSEEQWRKFCSEIGKKNKGRIYFPEITKSRIDLIRNSDVDFSKFGWVQKVSKITGVHTQHINKLVKRHLPEIYAIAFKRRSSVI